MGTHVNSIEVRKTPSISDDFSRSLDLAFEPLMVAKVSITEDVRNTLDTMLSIAKSITRFDSKSEFNSCLTEGLMLNINTLAANSLLIPPGEYVVWMANPADDSAMLVPVSNVQAESELYINPKQYEVHLSKLSGCWNKLERVIGEEDEKRGEEGNDAKNKKYDELKKHSEKSRSTVFQSQHPGRIHPLDTNVVNAIEASSKSQSEIADELGVDKSTVSRWTTDHSTGGRTPSLKNAGEFANLTGVPVTSIFTKELDMSPASNKKRSKTSGSGGGRNKAFRRGNA